MGLSCKFTYIPRIETWRFLSAIFHSREITIRGSFKYYEDDYSPAIDLMSKGHNDADGLISVRFPFDKGYYRSYSL
ncbi:AIS_HP2_G0015790.mRNA.1.CDS.1 [Saccharomyces cerevisiae]|nr:AIS_HP2_G0015790.mRNA.1.CDS.1 [Saccharomyces cerevisiae]CAI6484496.1 AIS_HP2_G0015790.mRNA.1.CDS.1 [Saccharomyces cerevisiae]